MRESENLDTAQLEEAAAAVVGQIVFALSRLEFNLGLYLRNAVGGNDADAVNPLVSRLSFKSKIDALRDVVEHKFASNESCLSEFRHWYAAIEKYRIKRNSFVHGRWGMHHYAQQVINVAPGLPNSKPQKETRYTLAELGSELSEANEIAASFGQWSKTWPL